MADKNLEWPDKWITKHKHNKKSSKLHPKKKGEVDKTENKAERTERVVGLQFGEGTFVHDICITMGGP